MGLINNVLMEMLVFIFCGTYKISTHLSSHVVSRIYICNNFVKHIQKKTLHNSNNASCYISQATGKLFSGTKIYPMKHFPIRLLA